MKRSNVLIIVILLASCSVNNITGYWKLDDRSIQITDSKIIFESNHSDFLYYDLFLKDSLVVFTTEVDPEYNTWNGKIILFEKDKIVYFDSLWNKEYVLIRNQKSQK